MVKPSLWSQCNICKTTVISYKTEKFFHNVEWSTGVKSIIG